MAIQSVRPIIGAQHPLGHDLIDGEHVVLAEWWLRTVKSEVRRRVVRRL
jgi:hypothetical protein